jgi:hypothetical protein
MSLNTTASSLTGGGWSVVGCVFVLGVVWLMLLQRQGSQMRLRVDRFLAKQQLHLGKWEAIETSGERWETLHNDHFDWWMFPIDGKLVCRTR